VLPWQSGAETIHWLPELGPSTYGIFDTFEAEAGRQATCPPDCKSVDGQAPELLSTAPVIEW